MTTEYEIAGLIAGEDPSVSLILSISRARKALHWTIKKGEESPSRNELRKRLVALKAAADLVQDSLGDIQIQRVLIPKEAFFAHQYSMNEGLISLSSKIEQAIAGIRSGPGRDKAGSGSANISDQVYCALLVSAAWKKLHKVWPPHNSEAAQRACAELWRSAGGGNSGQWGKDNFTGIESVAVWRDHLKSAKDRENGPEAIHAASVLNAELSQIDIEEQATGG